MKLHNRKSLKQHRQRLRGNMTPAEARLWNALKKRKLGGRKFRRQHSIGPYIVDFYCPREKLAIELDGAVHNDLLRASYDAKRQDYIEALGITVLRFENTLIHDYPEDVLKHIRDHFTN